MNKNYMNLNLTLICRFDWFTMLQHMKINLLEVYDLDINKQYYLLKINDDYEIKYNSLEKAKKEFLNCVKNLLNEEK